MFRIELKPLAIEQLAELRRVDAVRILDAIETNLRHEPERTSRSRIKKLRGSQDAAYRLRAGDYRVFYDVAEDRVTVVAILHKRQTPTFYREG
jgi:mRNA-degrading endonuclease RelE of RelBE toxin-antitoxin system